MGKLRPTEALLLEPESNVIEKYPSSTDPEKGDADLEDEATVPSGFAVATIPANLLEIGDVVRVRNGASPPTDGIVVAGQSGTFDESALTGESKPIKKGAGDPVFIGTINMSRPVDVQVTSIGEETM